MKWRVAIAATLLNLLTCILLMAVLAGKTSNNYDFLLEEELKVTCRLSGEMLDSAAFVDRDEYLRGIANDGDMYVMYIEADGTVAFKNFDNVEDPGFINSILDKAARNTEGVFKREGFISSYMKLTDSSVLTYAKNETQAFAFLKENSITFIPIMLFVTLAQFVIIMLFVGRADRMTESVLGVLDDFTEGRFESRITNVGAYSSRVAAKYNAVFSRVQDRVFTQQRRNRVVGQMLNQMRNGLLTVNSKLEIVYASSNLVNLLGRDVKSAEHSSVDEYFGNEALEKAFSQAVASGKPQMFSTDMDGLNKDGAVVPIRVYASALFEDGKCTGAMAVIEDITEIRKLEQIRTDFAANVSHEMKTPLTSIKGYVETLEDGAIDNPEYARKFLHIISVEADRMYHLVNDIMSITKMESGNDVVEVCRLELVGIIKEVMMMLRPQAEDKQVTVKYRSSEEPIYIIGNRERVKQVFINLIENGIKYNKQGGSVDITREPAGEGKVAVLVSDTGIGIKEEYQGRLFERFYRVDKGRSREMGGTGLGLAIVKHIVNTMNGDVEVSSRYGEGSTFTVSLPLAPEDELQEE